MPNDINVGPTDSWKQQVFKRPLLGGTNAQIGEKKIPFSRKLLELMTGYPADPDQNVGPVDVMAAGLPFAHYAKNVLPEGKLFHGTQKIFEKFNPELNDKSDVLGWMTHFAEDPEYASRGYAGGKLKGNKSISFDPWNGPISDKELSPSFFNFATKKHEYNQPLLKPNVIPAHPQAKNVLDLVDPKADDLSQALANVDSIKRKSFINQFKATRKDIREFPTNSGKLLNPQHYGEYQRLNVPSNEIPVRILAEKLHLTPEEFDKSPFDAIRYRDEGEKSWAIPSQTPINTPWGTPLTENQKPIRILKTDKPTGGSLMMNYSNKVAGLSKSDPDWATKVIETSPSIDNDKVMEMYYNNVISASEKNQLLGVLTKKLIGRK